jgi:glycosyltransferase involved in cell wall biosynthesis
VGPRQPRAAILAISHYLPVPIDSGGAVRIDGIVRSLRRSWDVRLLLSVVDGADERGLAAWAEELGVELELHPRDRPALTSARRWAQAIGRGAPPWVLEEHNDAIADRATELIAEIPTVLLLDDYTAMYAQDIRRAAPDAVIIADKHRVLGATPPAGPEPGASWSAGGIRRRVHGALGTTLTRRFERGALRSIDAVAVTSAEESDRLEHLYGRVADAVIPSAVDALDVRAQEPGGRDIAWLGLLDYEPNLAGLRRFLDEGWPELADAGCRLLVAGRGDPAVLASLARVPGVTALGFVDDLRGLLATAAVAVVPLWEGAGVKLKTLTFLGAGIPTVATPVAVEGLGARNGEHCLIAEHPGELAADILRLLDDPDLAHRLGGAGAALVRETMTWDAVSTAVQSFVASWYRAARPVAAG